MEVYKAEATIEPDGSVKLPNLPFRPGERVEVTIAPHESSARASGRYPLRGKPIHYINPTEPVAETEWEAAK
jgi:hypothetical protein